ncbi:MAG: ATPase [Chloroflexi bacterium]|nr:ATPase [Chloroflexota bacterium]MDA8189084.1 hypothetical protein [Dehalococcoidales bacterium]
MNFVKTGTSGLDDMLRGGFLRESAVLVQGAPGTGKTTLGLQFICSGAIQFGEPGLFITFEEFPQQLYRDAGSFGWDLRSLEQAGKLRVMFTSPETLLAELESPDSQLSDDIKRLRTKRVVVDSASHFKELTSDPIALRHIFRSIIGAFKREGMTALYTAEDYHLLGLRQEEAHGLAFLVDTIVLLRYVEIEGGMRRAILTLKVRGSDHDKDIRQLEIGPRGMHIQSRFKGHAGLLSGSPYRSISQRALEAFG